MQDAVTNGAISLTPTARISVWSATHRWWVLAATVVVLVLGVAASAMLEVKLQDGDGGVGESDAGAQILNERFPRGSSASEQLLFSHDSLSVDDPAYEAIVSALAEQLRALPQVRSVDYDVSDPSMVSDDRLVLRAEVVVDREIAIDGHRADAILDAVADARAAAEDDGYTIAIVGKLTLGRELNQMIDEDFGSILFISLGLGLIIMLLAFRAVVAAMIPLVLAVGAIVIATGIAAAASQVYSLNESYSEMILLLGLAVGIDYSLFIVSRFRFEREAGRPKFEAIAVASNTTGRAVFYAGVTVVISLLGLMLTNHPIFISLGMGAIFVVLVTIVGSITFLPAVLGVLGDNINRLRVPFLGRVRGNGIWGAITDRVMARPAIFAGLTAAALIALSVPAASLNLGFPTGSKAFNDALSGKAALRLMEQHFTGGLTDPVIVVVSADDVSAPEVQGAVAAVVAAMEADADSFFGPFAVVPNPDGDALFIRAPVSGETELAEIAVRKLRDDLVPSAFGGVSATVYVSGFPAGNMDFREYMYARAPYVFAFVLGLAFLILLVMFRSLVIPIKSIILNLLSVGASYGVLVIVFQWGYGVSILGSEASGVIVAWLPLFLFAILFGLSMDYHMLLLNRVKETHDRGAPNDLAVAMGIKLTAGQITSAAAVMVGVFGAFALGREVGLQQFGIGLGVSVLIDATVVRSVLLPATMKLLGDWNWYLPSWLGWLPKVSVPGEGADAMPTDAAG
jgi:uncharacterized membrane protein YdfJ with MMPL/SSD domain